VKVRLLLLVAIAWLNLPGCAEREQKLVKKAGSDAPAWSVSGAANPAFKAPGWTPGDQASWEGQIHRRNQTQNDYSR
jgi:transcription elongation factor